jgi:hypothetical protein
MAAEGDSVGPKTGAVDGDVDVSKYKLKCHRRCFYFSMCATDVQRRVLESSSS